MYTPKYFKAYELVSKSVYDKYGESALIFFDEKLLRTIDQLREFFGKPVVINNWKSGGDLSQRALRENTCKIVKDKTSAGKMYLSQHIFGRAADFHIVGMSIDDVYNAIIKNHEKFEFLRRIEDIRDTKTFIHIDVMPVDKFTIFRG